jgi:hypothetical protein
MYQTNVTLTYNYYDDQFQEYNNKQNVDLSIIDYKDKTEDVAEYLFRSEFLQVFDLTELNEKEINSKIDDLSAQMYQHKEFSLLMEKAAGKILSEDFTAGLMLMFSYHSFFLVHRCICIYLKSSSIPAQYLEDLSKSLF